MIGYFEDYTKRKHQLLCKKLTNTGCQTHFHGEMELSYVLNGTHKIMIGNETQILTSGDMYYCNPYELHECHSDDFCEHILFTIRPFEYAPVSNLLKSSLQNFLKDKKFNSSVLNILEEIIIKQDTLNSLERQGYIALILGSILKHYGYHANKGNNLNRFEEVLVYIDNHYKEPIDRDSIAEIFGYSPTYFSRLFQENFHCGLLQYINNLRYERTLSDLALSNGRKTDIILSNGFNNVQSFYRINRERKSEYNNLKEFHN
ncbi:MAG: AraC family transcriptional regulator [Clostridia bacterium]|nr:AraC family transcriptional regulator [Clostridia bacterium]